MNDKDIYTVETLEVLIDELNNNGTTLKAAKSIALAVADKLAATNPSDDNGCLNLLKNTEIVRTKAAMIESLGEIARKSNGIVYEEEQEEEEDMPEETKDISKELEQLANNIKSNIEQAQACHLSAGKCLLEANELIKANGGKQGDFIDWARDNVGIKKAQAYNLIKVWKTFGDDSDFAFCSMRVLYTLSKQSDKVIEAAREQAANGTLETKDVYRIIDDAEGTKPQTSGSPVEPVKRKEDKESGTPIVSMDAELATENEALKAEIEVFKKGQAPSNNKEVESLKAEIAELKALKSEGSGSSDKDEEIEALRSTIKDLQDVIASMKEASTAKESAVPYLPQFDSDNMAVRLGLEPEYVGTKAKVNQAYRALAKIYTKATNEPASIALKEARDTLLAG